MQFNYYRLYHSRKSFKILGIIRGNNNFKASSGWLHNFKQRYSIQEYNKHGESQSAPITQIPIMREDLKNILKEYRAEDIFNCDETGLFWKMEPSRGLSTGSISG